MTWNECSLISIEVLLHVLRPEMPVIPNSCIGWVISTHEISEDTLNTMDVFFKYQSIISKLRPNTPMQTVC